MGKTTNILDLNNRLTKVEKENIAQNNYNSLKNRPKINGNLLTGDKTSTQLGLANAQDVGNLSDLTTNDKSSCVGAINEVVSGASLHDIGNDYTFADLTAEQKVTWFTNWTDNVNFPALYGSGVLMPGTDTSQRGIIYLIIGADGNGEVYTNTYKNGAWGKWSGPGLTYGTYQVNDATDVKDFIKKAIQQAHTDLANKKAYTLYNIFAIYDGVNSFCGTIDRIDIAGYAFSLSTTSGENIYQGYYDISSDHINVFRFDGVAI